MLNWLTECDEGLPDEGGPLAVLSECKLRVGDAAEAGFDWLQDNLSGVFDAMSAALEVLIEAILAVLQSPPNTGWFQDLRRSEITYLYPEAWHPILITALFALLAWWLHRNWRMPALIAVGLLFIINQDYWDETTESLTLVLAACVVCMGIGVPVGIAAAHRPRLYAWMRPVLDLMQTLPTFVYLIPAIVFFGIGMVPGLIATVIFVLPAPIRLTHLGISSTPRALMEAADAFGATPRQKLWKVEFPSALPQIMAGLNQTIMLSLSMVVIAALVGASGLGVPVVRALNQVNTGLGFEAGLIIVVVAILLDRLLRVPSK
ncbi:choline ABC transporter permease subunit [Roseibacterium sp. SDUM158017]|uniref:choline ABC transporter permease subunit n=1 Tax=Roseicyclus salinarum TaxID=3036773 RepID=UPI00241501A6|nr:choline ABC transporter permease subunit [Roseibacterium sp. SDUM158017]MDG4647737.1 choline ABC transporter permease subunit [Roseibacterium sp. SDUM158017]